MDPESSTASRFYVRVDARTDAPRIRQKFRAGDRVKVSEWLSPGMRHFAAGGGAIVLYSYNERYGDGTEFAPENGNEPQYCINFCDGRGTHAWYNENDLKLITKSV